MSSVWSYYSSSIVWKGFVHHHVGQGVDQLWLTIAAQDEASLIMEDSLFKLLKNFSQIYADRQLKLDKFLELIMPRFDAGLRLKQWQRTKTNQFSLNFARMALE